MPPPPTPTITPTPGPGQQRIPLAAAIDRVANRVPALRGLATKRAIEPKVMTRTELHARLEQDFQDPEIVEAIRKEEALFKVLRLMPLNEDLQKTYVAVYSEQVEGFFDTETEELYVIAEGGMLSITDEISLAHEYLHALQQQHFNLHATENALEDLRDEAMGYISVVEGDAVIVQTLYALGTFSQQDLAAATSDIVNTPAYDAAPNVVKAGIIFPYTTGAEFVAALYQRDGRTFKGVHATLGKPPRSTAEIMHPQRYTSGIAPVTVNLPNLAGALGAGWDLVDQQPLGELLIKLWIEEELGGTRGAQAGAGWAGDTYGLYRHTDGRLAFALRTTWDNEGEAQQFYESYELALQNSTTWRRVSSDATRQTWRSNDQSAFASRKGAEVLVLLAPDQALVDKLRSSFSEF